MSRVWQYPQHDESLVRELSNGLRVPAILAQIMTSREVRSLDEGRGFLEAKLTELHEPDLLPGISAAADRVTAAVRDGRKITIYGDYDVDGVTAVSILWHCLRLSGAKVDYYIPHRLDEGYGLNDDAVRKLAAEDPGQLVITVDCGVASPGEARLAAELGLELIVTDHHQFADELPLAAAAICHPRLPVPDGTPAYPFGELCGAGVAFKLAWAICQRMGDGRKASPRMREFLMTAVGLVAIGTVADCVPLIGENRVLVRYGLGSLKERATVGLKALMQCAGLAEKETLQAEDVAFTIGPRINAAGRLGQARLAVELLTTDQPDRAHALAGYLEEQNKIRQTVERRILKQAKEQVEQHPDWLDGGALVLAASDWHAGVIGIVASRVAEAYQKPTVMISINGEDGTGQGSARSFAGYDLHAGLTACAAPLMTYGGHQAAAGLRLKADRIDEFRELFADHARRNHMVTVDDTAIQIDAEVRLADLTVRAVRDLERLGPFGRSNPRPVLCSTRVDLAEPPRKMGEGERHLSLTVRHHGARLRAVAFGAGDWADEIAAAGGPISICFAPQINTYRGMESVELRLLDWKAAEVPAGTGAAS
jgi:single-stranded-DNA-specific exonuclease